MENGRFRVRRRMAENAGIHTLLCHFAFSEVLIISPRRISFKWSGNSLSKWKMDDSGLGAESAETQNDTTVCAFWRFGWAWEVCVLAFGRFCALAVRRFRVAQFRRFYVSAFRRLCVSVFRRVCVSVHQHHDLHLVHKGQEIQVYRGLFQFVILTYNEIGDELLVRFRPSITALGLLMLSSMLVATAFVASWWMLLIELVLLGMALIVYSSQLTWELLQHTQEPSTLRSYSSSNG